MAQGVSCTSWALFKGKLFTFPKLKIHDEKPFFTFNIACFCRCMLHIAW